MSRAPSLILLILAGFACAEPPELPVPVPRKGRVGYVIVGPAAGAIAAGDTGFVRAFRSECHSDVCTSSNLEPGDFSWRVEPAGVVALDAATGAIIGITPGIAVVHASDGLRALVDTVRVLPPLQGLAWSLDSLRLRVDGDSAVRYLLRTRSGDSLTARADLSITHDDRSWGARFPESSAGGVVRIFAAGPARFRVFAALGRYADTLHVRVEGTPADSARARADQERYAFRPAPPVAPFDSASLRRVRRHADAAFAGAGASDHAFDRLIVRLAELQLESGDLPAARSTAGRAAHPGWTLGWVMSRQIHGGAPLDEVVATADLAPDSATRGWALSSVRGSLRQTKRYDDLERVLQLLPGRRVRHRELREEAEALMRDDPAAARRLLQEAIRLAAADSASDFDLQAIADDLVRAGDMETPLAYLPRAGPTRLRAERYVRLGAAMALAGHPRGDSLLREARALADTVREPAARESMLRMIESREARSRAWQRARMRLPPSRPEGPAAVDTLPATTHFQTLLGRAGYYAGRGDFRTVVTSLQALRSVPVESGDVAWHLPGLLQLVDWQTERWSYGMRDPPVPADTLRLVVSEILAFAERLDRSQGRDSVRLELALAQARVDPAGAERTGETLHPAQRERIRMAIGVGLARAGRLGEAEGMYGTLESQLLRDTLARVIGEVAMRRNEPRRVAAQIRRIRTPGLRGRLLMTLGRAELAAGLHGRARRSLRAAARELDPTELAPQPFSADGTFYVADSVVAPLGELSELAFLEEWARGQPSPRRRAAAWLFVAETVRRFIQRPHAVRSR